MLHDNNLIEMSLRLNRSEPLFRSIRELLGIGKRPRTRDDIRLRRNLPIGFMIVRQKRDQTFLKFLKFHGRTAKTNTNLYI